LRYPRTAAKRPCLSSGRVPSRPLSFHAMLGCGGAIEGPSHD
jgi:hypothetical protein